MDNFETENKKSFSNHMRWHSGLMDKKSYIGINRRDKNGMWKGDNVKRNPLHDFIKYHLPKPKICQICGKERFLDLANRSGKYLRELSDFRWICRSCHMISDGRMKNLKKGRYS
jgi:hypothetical protein